MIITSKRFEDKNPRIESQRDEDKGHHSHNPHDHNNSHSFACQHFRLQQDSLFSERRGENKVFSGIQKIRCWLSRRLYLLICSCSPWNGLLMGEKTRLHDLLWPANHTTSNGGNGAVMDPGLWSDSFAPTPNQTSLTELSKTYLWLLKSSSRNPVSVTKRGPKRRLEDILLLMAFQ